MGCGGDAQGLDLEGSEGQGDADILGGKRFACILQHVAEVHCFDGQIQRELRVAAGVLALVQAENLPPGPIASPFDGRAAFEFKSHCSIRLDP